MTKQYDVLDKRTSTYHGMVGATISTVLGVTDWTNHEVEQLMELGVGETVQFDAGRICVTRTADVPDAELRVVTCPQCQHCFHTERE